MIRIPSSLSTTMLDDELVLLDKTTGKYFGLNPVGSRIFQLLKETGDQMRVVATLLAEYDAPEDRLKADVAAFVDMLVSKKLVAVDAP